MFQHRQPGMPEQETDLDARVAAVAANVNNTTLATFLRALTSLWYPDHYDDFVSVPPNTTISLPFNFPGSWQISQLLLMPVGNAYPSRLDVIIESFRHVPFVLSAAQPHVGPFSHRMMGGSDMTITNHDAAIACELYMEFRILRIERGALGEGNNGGQS